MRSYTNTNNMPRRDPFSLNRRVIPEGTTNLYREGDFHADFNVLSELGRGRFAVVRQCEHKETGRHFAAKFIRKRKMGKDCRDDILKEIGILEKSSEHPRIIELHQIYESPNEVILVLEFAKGGELHPYCVGDRDGSFTEQDVVRLVYQLLEGVRYLHKQSIVHLDLKPQNILLTASTVKEADIKLIDFGVAKRLTESLEIREIVGTPDYVAPEILSFEPISLATDMWSIGVVAYVMLTGTSPFAGDTKQETFLNIAQVSLDFPEDLFENVSQEAQNFIKSLCVNEPEKRLSAVECLSHPWFRLHLENGTLSPCKNEIPNGHTVSLVNGQCTEDSKHSNITQSNTSSDLPPSDVCLTPQRMEVCETTEVDDHLPEPSQLREDITPSKKMDTNEFLDHGRQEQVALTEHSRTPRSPFKGSSICKTGLNRFEVRPCTSESIEKNGSSHYRNGSRTDVKSNSGFGSVVVKNFNVSVMTHKATHHIMMQKPSPGREVTMGCINSDARNELVTCSKMASLPNGSFIEENQRIDGNSPSSFPSYQFTVDMRSSKIAQSGFSLQAEDGGTCSPSSSPLGGRRVLGQGKENSEIPEAKRYKMGTVSM